MGIQGVSGESREQIRQLLLIGETLLLCVSRIYKHRRDYQKLA